MKAIEDYLTSEVYHLDKDTTSQINSPKSNVIRVLFDEGFIALRPSGTEPKIKLYVSLKCPNFDDVAQKLCDEFVTKFLYLNITFHFILISPFETRILMFSRFEGANL